MTKEQMRIVISECCGWERQGHNKSEDIWWNGKTYAIKVAELPNYPEDLNACHEMEKVLIEKEGLDFHDYNCHLINMCEQARLNLSRKDGKGMTPYRATSLQRCEAFIKTVCPERWVE